MIDFNQVRDGDLIELLDLKLQPTGLFLEVLRATPKGVKVWIPSNKFPHVITNPVRVRPAVFPGGQDYQVANPVAH